MKPVRLHSLAAMLAACTLLCVGIPAAWAQSAAAVPGEKIDSGLGDLPHYSQWKDPTGKGVVATNVAGQKLDSGLGDLPPYAQWTDRSGKAPMKRETSARALGSSKKVASSL